MCHCRYETKTKYTSETSLNVNIIALWSGNEAILIHKKWPQENVYFFFFLFEFQFQTGDISIQINMDKGTCNT